MVVILFACNNHSVACCALFRVVLVRCVRGACWYTIMCTCSDVAELVGVSSVGMCRKEWWRTPVGFVRWEYLCLLPVDDVGMCICNCSACIVRGAGIIRSQVEIKRIFTAFTTTRTTRNTNWRQRTRGIMSGGGMVQGPSRGGQVNRGNTAGEAQKNITACLKTV